MPASNATVSLIVIWEDEIRKAAALLSAAREETDDELVSVRMTEAYAACEVALAGIDETKAVVMLGNKDLHDAVKLSKLKREE